MCIQIFAHVLIKLFEFSLLLNCVSSLYFLYINPLFGINILIQFKIVFHHLI